MRPGPISRSPLLSAFLLYVCLLVPTHDHGQSHCCHHVPAPESGLAAPHHGDEAPNHHPELCQICLSGTPGVLLSEGLCSGSCENSIEFLASIESNHSKRVVVSIKTPRAPPATA